VSTALEIHGCRMGGLCYYGQSGIGWPGPHHCFFCYVALEQDCRR
jgi:hypothetical protein